jgi:hypothetical protein
MKMILSKKKLVLGLLAATLTPAHVYSADLQAPFRVEANGKPIDMDVGNAAPFMVDFDGDGVKDLMLGQRGECKLRIYRNLGSNKQPKFGTYAFFKVGGVDASLPGG